jgi:hypothetical protein
MKKKDLLKERKPVKVPKRGYVCHDGPMTGQTLFLSTAYTAILTIGNRTGRYMLAQDSGTLRWQDC